MKARYKNTGHDPTTPWGRLPDETDTAYHRFSIYLELGPDRSISKVAEKLQKGSGYAKHLRRWSSKHNWVYRAGKYDEHMILKSLKNKEEIIDRGKARILKMVDKALDNLEEVLLLPMGDIEGEGYRSYIREKLKAVEMVLNRAGIIEQKDVIETNDSLSVNNYIANIYNRIEKIQNNGQDE